MAKSGMERAADLGQAAKAIYDIIKAGLKGGWQGAAVAALKAYWPKILPVAIVIVLLPAIIICSLPAILFGWDGDNEYERAEQIRAAYERYEEIRNEQINHTYDIQNGLYEIKLINESFDKNWLIAIHSVEHDNNLFNMTAANLEELIRRTYTYEIEDIESKPETPATTVPDDDAERETEPGRPAEPKPTQPYDPAPAEPDGTNPWEDTAYNPGDSNKPDEIIKVTTISPLSVMAAMRFTADKIDWAKTIYETLSTDYSDTL